MPQARVVDSKGVSKAIAGRVWPALKELGFSDTSTRAAWRKHDDRIDILVFRAFNSYELQRCRLKAGSFWIELACHLQYVRYPATSEEHLKHESNRPMPESCLLRGKLRRGFRWPLTVEREVWPVGAVGVNVDKAVDDARAAILGEGMKWFDQFATPAKVYPILTSGEEEQMSSLYGFGRPGSPMREYASGFTALALGRREDAGRHLKSALDSGHLPLAADRIRREMENL